MVLPIHIEGGKIVLGEDLIEKVKFIGESIDREWEGQELFDRCSFFEVLITSKNVQAKEIDEIWILQSFQKRLMRRTRSSN